jgi:predicted CoA-binding protein
MTKKTVAVVGASADRSKFSNKAVRAYQKQGWQVYPINPKGGDIEGLAAYRTLADVPVRIDRVTLYLPPALGMQVLPDVVKAKPEEFFVNPGADTQEVMAEAERLGLEPIAACSIVDIGVSPAQFP